MDNKKRMIIGFTLVLIIILGLNYVFGTFVAAETRFLTNIAPNTSSKEAQSELWNITFNWTNTETDTGDRISGVNITVFNNATVAPANLTHLSGDQAIDATFNDTSIQVNWSLKTTENATGIYISWHNDTTVSNPSNITNGSLWIVTFNITANETITTEQNVSVELRLYNDTASVVSTTFYHYIDGMAPTMSEENLNATEGWTNNASNNSLAGRAWLGNRTNITIMVNVSDGTLNITNITLWYNNTNGVPNVSAATDRINMSLLGGNTYFANLTNNSHGIGHGINISFIITATDVHGHMQHLNNSGKGYNITIDGTLPSATLTRVTSLNTIEVLNPITYKCEGNDDYSGVRSCTMTVTKPDDTTYEKTGCGTEHKLQNTETNQAGSYTVVCKTIDYIGWSSTTSSVTFTASYSTSAGGGEAAPSVPSAPEITEEVPAEKTLGSGESVTYSVRESSTGELAEHTIEVVSVGTSSATLSIADQTVIIGVGESSSIDLDGDGIDDLEASLEGIVNGKADLTFRTLVSAPTVGEEEEVVAEEVAEEKGLGTGAIILIIVIVLAVIGIGAYLIIKKKKK